jgi:16S rRNA (cytosine1402-N4)-methyltransferase/phosphatidylglycerol:prolipoprotein diacylglycerol transferase
VPCGLIVTCLYIWWKRIPVARFIDALAIGLLVASIILAIGQFLSGDGYGTTTDVPWAIQFLGELRHPVQIYESVLLLIGLIAIKGFLKSNMRDGIFAGSVIAWYSGTHLFIDAFRADVAVLPNGYRTSQVVALIVLLVALWGMMRIVAKDERRMEESK